MLVDHVSEVVELWNGTEGLILTYSDNASDLSRYFADNPEMSHVAVCDGQVIGAALCGHDGRRGYLHHVAVQSEQRGQGIGQALVNACLSKLNAVGIEQCNLFVVNDNDDGKRFWTDKGWSEWPNIRLMSKRLDEE